MIDVHADPASANPSQSNRRPCPGAFLIQANARAMPMKPSGTFKKKIQRHEEYVVMKPPTGGPMTGAANPGHVM
jgi:hypothetical protein